MIEKPTNIRLDMIDGLRGVAIFAVIYQHVYAYAFGQAVAKSGIAKWPWGLTNAWLGVSLFFVLSGFVLGMPFMNGKREMLSTLDARQFLLHRAKRLLPLFAIACMVGYLVKLHMTVIYLPSLFLPLTTMNMFTFGEFFPLVNNVYWSLSIEIWFCILFPILFFSMKRFGLGKTFLFVIVMALGIRLVGTQIQYFNPHINPVKDSVLARLDDFLLGIVLSKLYVDGRFKKIPQYFAVLGVALVYGVSLIWHPLTLKTIPYEIAAFMNIGASAGFALIIASSLAEKSILAKILSIWPLRLAGAMCFSLYTWHFMLIDKFMLAEPFSLRNNIAYWTVLLMLSFATYKFIEFPNASLKTLLRFRERARLSSDLLPKV